MRNILVTTCLFLLSGLTNVSAQAEATPTSEAEKILKISKIEIESATIPNTKDPWLKLVCTFTTSKPWIDAVSFSYTVLLQATGEGGKDQIRVVRSAVAYANIPRGQNQAILYLSPSVVKRYGSPRRIQIQAGAGDDILDQVKWSDPAKSVAVGDDWPTRYPVQDGVLLHVTRTPWVVWDYGRTPDLN
jgi:hypothetical protein